MNEILQWAVIVILAALVLIPVIMDFINEQEEEDE